MYVYVCVCLILQSVFLLSLILHTHHTLGTRADREERERERIFLASSLAAGREKENAFMRVPSFVCVCCCCCSRVSFLLHPIPRHSLIHLFLWKAADNSTTAVREMILIDAPSLILLIPLLLLLTVFPRQISLSYGVLALMSPGIRLRPNAGPSSRRRGMR